MKRLKGKVVTGLAFAVVAAALYVLAAPSYRQGEPSIAGSRAPDFPLTLDGNSTHLSALRGKVVVLNFWASWCQPCVEEAPSLNRLQQHIAPLGGTILGISIDEDPAGYERFLQTQGVNYPTYRDPSKSIATQYGTNMWPETYILTRDGHIGKKVVGPQEWDSAEFTSYIQRLLGQK
jgi:cytochrome c biogenesis protein CcmG/thiol:disulfide interchange protein DsbE